VRRTTRIATSILLSLMISLSYMPAGFALTALDAPESETTEAADQNAASGLPSDEMQGVQDIQPESGEQGEGYEEPEDTEDPEGSKAAEDIEDPEGSEWTEDVADPEGSSEAEDEEAAEEPDGPEDIEEPDDAGDPAPEEQPAATAPAAEPEETDVDEGHETRSAAVAVTVDEGIENGSIVLEDNEGICIGTATPDSGYDLATVRQIWTDAAGKEHEQYIDYKPESNGTYTFEAESAEADSVITAYFFDIQRWDGAVDITWYDPDETVFEISTPAQLAGLAAITNGMVDTAVTEEYMIKDNEGRSFADGAYSHAYISTEPAMADLLTPNFSDGAGQIRDTVWRLPEVSHTMIAEDDLHNDFLYRTVILTADIDMGDKNWTPIGGKYAMNRDAVGDQDPKVIDTRFQGVLDGRGHTVTLNCDRVAKKGFAYAMEIAFIGYLGGGVDYKNGYPKDTYMDYAQYWVPTVRNVVIKGSIKGRRMVGGVVGRIGETNYGVLVEKCANFADIYATDMRGCGGIAGAGWGKGTIRNCYNSGTIRSFFWEHGGIIGSNGYEGSEGRDAVAVNIYNCYNVGVTGTAGSNTETPVYDGQEIGTDGQTTASYIVANCYYPEPESPIEGRTGYSIGETTMNKKVRINNVEAADLRSEEVLDKLNANGDVFVEDTNNINDGYPVLYFQGECGTQAADVTINQTEGGTVSSRQGLTGVEYGTTIDFIPTPDEGKRLTGYRVTAEGEAEKQVPSNGFFTVTGKDITVEGIFDDQTPSTLRFVEAEDGFPYYIKVEKLLDPNDISAGTEELSSGDQVMMDDVIRITPVDICLLETQPDIKYLEYTGKFNDPTYTDRALIEKSKTAKTYKVTGEVEDVDIEVNPKTQGKMWISVADTSWYTEGAASFTITNARQLAGLVKLCRNGNSFEGVTIKLGNDIGLENTEANSGDVYGYERSWVGIGASERYPFKGIFDGQGHKISFMHRNFAPGYCDGANGGLFGVTDGAVIRNVTVEGGSYVNEQYDVTMDCAFINGANGGGIIGTAIDTLIENCTAKVDMKRAYSAGGIVGTAEGATVIRNCVSECSMEGSNEAVGGIAGRIGDSGVQISDCVNKGTIRSNSWKVGGILGSGESYSADILRCVNNGSISVTMKGTSSNVHAAGGIIGYAGGTVTCKKCINKGDVSGYNRALALGGIAGTVIRGVIEDCYNTGKVRSESISNKAQVSGIANVGTNAYMHATIKNCYNTGAVSTGSDYTGSSGGVAGTGNTTANTIENVYCTASAAKAIGGSAGVAGKVVSDASLKKLGVPLGNSFIRDRKGINSGFPVLDWQDPTFSADIASFTVTKTSETSITIKWSAVGPKTGFELYCSANGGSEKKIYSGTALSYTDKGLTTGGTYKYRVRTYKKYGTGTYKGEWSAAKSLKLPMKAMKLSSVKNKKTKKAVIKWKRVADAAGYELYCAKSKKGSFKKLKTVKVTTKNKNKKTLSYTHKKLKKKKTYYYKIRYYKMIAGKKVYSDYSAVKKVVIKK